MNTIEVQEFATALVVFGATGTVSMVVHQAAVRSFAVDLLPVALAARVRWWRDHSAAALGVSVLLLLLGLAGLLFL